MSRPVSQEEVLPAAERAQAASDDAAASAVKSLGDHPVETAPAIEIRESELTFLSKECNISRADALELIQKANGHLKEAIRLYLRR
jgi:DNA uptake protein ComE-like DNA-binding protein